VQSRPDEHRRNIAVNYWYRPFLNKEFPCASCRLFPDSRYDRLLRELGPLASSPSTMTTTTTTNASVAHPLFSIL
jgi:hypothetical protein